MKTKNALKVSGGNLAGAEIHVGDRVNVRVSKGSTRPASYPEGCIGAHLAKRNYVKYLVERYNHYREADARFGRTERFHYSVLFKNIESKFKAPPTSFQKVVLANWWTFCITALTTRFLAA